MTIVSTDNGEHYIWGEKCDGWHLAKTENLSVIQECVPPNCSEIRHYHNVSEQFFYVLSGIATLEIAGDIHQLQPNQGIHIQPKVPHQLSNQQSENLIFIVISTPPSHGDRVRA